MIDHRSKYQLLTGAALAAIILLSATGCSSNAQPKHIAIHADYKKYDNLKEAIRDADVIVVGKVNTVRPPQEWNINLDKTKPPVNEVYTLADIEVIDTVKGPAPGTSITIKQAGGEFKGNIYEIEGTKYVARGKAYVLFLNSYEDRSPGEPFTFIHPAQGGIEVKNDSIQLNKEVNYVKAGVSKGEFIEELKAINAALPPRNK